MASYVNAQHKTSLPLTHHYQFSIDTLKPHITHHTVAPKTFLNHGRPVENNISEQLPPTQGMDKRHPSSFQQLEKVGHLTLGIHSTYTDYYLHS